MSDNTSYSDTLGDRWLETPVIGHFPPSAILLRIASETTPEQPSVTRYMIGEMAGRRLPFGIDYPDSLENAMSDADERFGVNKADWTERTSEHEFVDVFDDAIDDAVQRASVAYTNYD